MSQNHIPTGVLYEFVRAIAALDEAWQNHLDGCQTCRHRLGWMRAASTLGSEERGYEPPNETLDAVIAFGRNSPRTARLSRRIIASVTYDSVKDLLPGGVRRGDLGARQVTYRADELEITVRVQRSDEQTWVIVGQVLGLAKNLGATPVMLLVDERPGQTTTLSAWGEFLFDNLPQAVYSLQILLPDRIIDIPSLGAQPA